MYPRRRRFSFLNKYNCGPGEVPVSLQSSLHPVEHIEIISATKIHNNRPTAILGAPPDLDGGGGGVVVTGDISIHVSS